MKIGNKLILGTVQFGLDYGINNFNGQPSLESSLEILKYAYDNGITTFDTAMAYGNAEEILGKFIERNKLNQKVKVISKLKPNVFDESQDIVQIVTEEVLASISRMKVAKLDGYLLHTPEYIYNDKILRALEIVKNKGLVSKVGVSIYNEKEALYAASLNEVDYIQVPYSLFDQRLDKTDFFDLTKENGIEVHARSAFVQGLLFMNENQVPSHLAKAKAPLKQLHEISTKYNVSIAKLALSFSASHKGIDKVVFGVDTLDQLQENMLLASNLKMPEEFLERLKQKFNNIDSYIVIPSLWKKIP